MAFDLDLDKIDNGRVMEQYRYAALKVLANCLDPAVSFKGKRSITVKISVEPDEQRNSISVESNVNYKLCSPIPAVTKMMLSKDIQTGRIHVSEYGSCIPGQSSLDDYGKDKNGDLIIPDDSNSELIDFRNAGKGGN
ncbi:MAG: hypothetical protein MR945_09245 [Agathobacter sp.]|nr:hypothetical protein [Agathobacter sp.]